MDYKKILIIAGIVLLLLLAIGAATFAAVTWITANKLPAYMFMGNATDLPDAPDNSDESATCEDYHIGDQYREFYGSTVIDNAAEACGMYGVYKSEQAVSGCVYDPAEFSIDCSTPQFDNFEQFCEISLKANWVCTDGFVGCICEVPVPELECDWIKVDEVDYTINQYHWTAWVDKLLGGFDYKFKWSAAIGTGLEVRVFEGDVTYHQTWNDETSGEYQFSTAVNETYWGIEASNYKTVPEDFHAELWQEVCEDDDTGSWNSGMFDETTQYEIQT